MIENLCVRLLMPFATMSMKMGCLARRSLSMRNYMNVGMFRLRLTDRMRVIRISGDAAASEPQIIYQLAACFRW